jgi:signal transduction histidine kinase
MFLRIPPKAFFKSNSFRLSIWYSGFFISSSLLILIATYFFLSSALKTADQEAILSELNELAANYDSHGMTTFHRVVEEDIKYRKKNPFFIRISDWANRTLFVFHTELWEEFDLGLLEKYTLTDKKSWIFLPAIQDDFELMILSKRLNDKRWLQVGMSSELRNKTVERFGEVFLVVMLPLVLIGFTGGTYLASRALRPIRNMIQTVQSIGTGDMKARVPRTDTQDELDELAGLFNEMLDRIQTLIIGMKGSLDNVAHDLRTPMTRLRNISETALRSSLDNGLCQEALTDCIEESERILKMLAALMDISEAETGVMSLAQTLVNISHLLTKIVDIYQYVAEEKGVHLKTVIPQELNLTIDVDRMSQVLANLIDNAIKYTPNGGHVIIEAHACDDECVITVRDTGIGISEDNLPKIWDRLYRGDTSRSTTGLGLGLSLVRAIVTAHGGRVSVKTTPGGGSSFTIILPVIQ